MAALRQVREKIQAMELELRTVEKPLREHALSIPNLPHESVPVWKRRTRQPGNSSMGQNLPHLHITPRSHFDLGEALGILDFPRATKIAGARFSVGIRDRRSNGTSLSEFHAGSSRSRSMAIRKYCLLYWSIAPA